MPDDVPMTPDRRRVVEELLKTWYDADRENRALDAVGRNELFAAIHTFAATVEREVWDDAEEWLEHGRECILSFYSMGEPTPDGGYRCKYKGVWYQASPVNETPKCDCGLDERRAHVRGEQKEPRQDERHQ